jgi:hypothetical protein
MYRRITIAVTNQHARFVGRPNTYASVDQESLLAHIRSMHTVTDKNCSHVYCLYWYSIFTLLDPSPFHILFACSRTRKSSRPSACRASPICPANTSATALKCCASRSLVPLTSVMYPAVPSIAGTSITYANESQAVLRVQRKYLWRLVVMSAPCQSAVSLFPSCLSKLLPLPQCRSVLYAA